MALVSFEKAGPGISPIGFEKVWLEKDYDPNQPRKPKGDPEGGEWVATRPKVIGSGDGTASSTRFINRIKNTIKLLPDHIAKISHIPIYVTPTLERLSSSPGRQTAGLFSWDASGINTKIDIAEGYYYGEGNRWLMRFMNPEGTITHEIGHALDQSNQWRLGSNLNFTRVMEQDLKKLNAKEWANSSYYRSSAKELFAELYNVAYCPNPPSNGKVFGGMTYSRARKVFANSIDYLKATLS